MDRQSCGQLLSARFSEMQQGSYRNYANLKGKDSAAMSRPSHMAIKADRREKQVPLAQHMDNLRNPN